MFTIEAMPKNKDVLRLMEQWDDRIAAVVQAMPQMVAQRFLTLLSSKAPTDIKGYPDMLSVKSIAGVKDWEIAGVIPPGWAFSQRLRSVDVARTVLYVRPRTAGGEVVSEAAVVLSRHNPWTMDTIPYEPNRREASILSRRITEREVQPIESARRRELDGVKAELRDLGVQMRPKGKVLLSRRVSRDIAFEILRREFGYPPMTGVAHWRPAIHMLPRISEKVFRELFGWFANPGDSRYTGVGDLQVEKPSVIKRVQKFQDLVSPA